MKGHAPKWITSFLPALAKPHGRCSTVSNYLVALGVPTCVASLLPGHGKEVARQFYRDLALDRHTGEDLEIALGLHSIMESLLAETAGPTLLADLQ